MKCSHHWRKSHYSIFSNKTRPSIRKSIQKDSEKKNKKIKITVKVTPHRFNFTRTAYLLIHKKIPAKVQISQLMQKTEIRQAVNSHFVCLWPTQRKVLTYDQCSRHAMNKKVKVRKKYSARTTKFWISSAQKQVCSTTRHANNNLNAGALGCILSRYY